MLARRLALAAPLALTFTFMRAARTPVHPVKTEIATFAGGCFWSMSRPFENTPGVTNVTVGYSGGSTANPTYEQVGTRQTGHAETVQVEFDPSRVSYDRLLDIYWHNVDPITKDAQFCDHGSDYRTAIFYHDDAQRRAAEASEAVVAKHFTKPIVTEIVPAGPFYRAEEYHQHYAQKNPVQYNLYRRGCGRDARLKQLWGAAAEPNVPPLEP
jgi:peptide-methionine (S)-S-oxide reductase